MAATTSSLDISDTKPSTQKAKYVVGGELAARAEAYRSRLKTADAKLLPFDQIINVNVGNPHQVGQRPITFIRQVLSLLEYPQLIERNDLLIRELGYQIDVIERAQWLLRECGGVGTYSHTQGVPAIRENVAQFIERKMMIYLVPERARNSQLTSSRT